MCRLEDTAFLMGRQQSRDHWSRKAIDFNCEGRECCEAASTPALEDTTTLRQPGHEQRQGGESGIQGLPLPMMKSPFEEAACQDRSDSPLRTSAVQGETAFKMPRKALAELQANTSSFDDSDSIRMDDLQSTVRLLSMSFGS